MKIKLKNRIVSALLALSMVASFLPGNMIPVVYAADCIDSAEVTLNPDGTFSVKLDGLNGATDTGNYHYALVPNVGVNSGYTLSDRLNNPTLVGGGFDPVDYSTLVSRLAAVGATNSTGYISNNLPGRVFTQEEKTSPPSGSFSITKTGNDNNGDPLTLPSFTDVRNALVAFAANGNRTLYFKDAEGNEKAVTYDKVVELVEIPYVFIFWGGADSIKAKYTVAHASYGAGGLLVNGPIVVNYQIGVKNDYSDYTWTPGEEVDGTFTPKPEWTGASFAGGDGGYPGIKYSINNGTGEDVTFKTEGCSFGGLASGLTFYTPNGDLVGAEINIPAGETYDLEIQFDSGDLAGTPTGKGTITIPWTGSGEAADNLVLEFELKTTTSSWEPENIDFTIRDTYDMTDPDWQATYVTLNSPYAKLIYHGPSVEFDPDACKTIAGAGGLAGSTITYWNTDSSGNATTEITSPITISEGKTIKMHVTPVAGVTYPGVIASVLGPKVTVTAGTATADVSITMRITRDERYTVTGKVASGEESRGKVSLVHNSDGATSVETTDTNGTVSIDELLAHSADKPSVVTVTATAKDGYRFNGWSIVKGTNTTSSIANPAYENVSADVTYTATFVANKVTVTVKEDTDNDTKGKQVRLVKTGTSAVFGTATTSTANNGVLEFSEVPNATYAVETSLDGTTWTKVTEVEVKDNDKTATVQYWTVKVETDPADGSGGTAWIGAANAADKTTKKVTVLDGDDVTISAEAKTGYRFIEWNGTATLPGTTEDITNITTGPRTYTAKFEKIGLRWQNGHNPAQNSKNWTIGDAAPTWIPIIAEQTVASTEGTIGTITYTLDKAVNVIPGVNIAINNAASGVAGVTLSGTPTASGTYTIKVTASAANGESIEQSFTVTVNKKDLPKPTGTGTIPTVNNASDGTITWTNRGQYPSGTKATLKDSSGNSVGTWVDGNNKWTDLPEGTYTIEVTNPDEDKYTLTDPTVDIKLTDPAANNPTISNDTRTYERNKTERGAGTTYLYSITTGNWDDIGAVSVGSGSSWVSLPDAAWDYGSNVLTLKADELDKVAGLLPGTLANGSYSLKVTFTDSTGLQNNIDITGGTLKVQTTYVVKFNAGDGASESGVTVPADKKETATTGNAAASFAYANATRPGYTLAGWSTNGHDTSAEWTSGNNYTPTTPATLEYTVYAVWDTNPITGDPQDFTGTVGKAFTPDYPVIQLAVEGISGFTYTHGSGAAGLPDLSAYGLRLVEDTQHPGRIIIEADTPEHATAGETAVPVTFTARAANGATKDITFNVTVYKQTLTAPTLTRKNHPTAAGTATGAITMAVPDYPTGAGTITYTLDGPSTPPVTGAGDIEGLLEGTYKVKATLTNTNDYKWATPITDETQSTWSDPVDLEDPGINRPTVANDQTFEKNASVTGRTSSFTFTFNTKDWTTVDKVQIGSHTLTEHATTGYKVDYDAGTASATTNRTGTITVPVKVLDDLDPQLANGTATVTVTFGRTGGTADTQTDTATCTLKVQTTYIVSFVDFNGGALSPAVSSVSKTTTDANVPTFTYANPSSVPTKSGYQYAGWTKAPKATASTGPADWYSTTGKTIYTPSTNVTTKDDWNTKVYATWTANVVTVTVTSDGVADNTRAKQVTLVRPGKGAGGTDIVIPNPGDTAISDGKVMFTAVPAATDYKIYVDGVDTTHSDVTAAAGAIKDEYLTYYTVKVNTPVDNKTPANAVAGSSYINATGNRSCVLLTQATNHSADLWAETTDDNYIFTKWKQTMGDGTAEVSTHGNVNPTGEQTGKYNLTKEVTTPLTTEDGPIVLTPIYTKNKGSLTVTITVNGGTPDNATIRLRDNSGNAVAGQADKNTTTGTVTFTGLTAGTYRVSSDKDNYGNYVDGVVTVDGDGTAELKYVTYKFDGNKPDSAASSLSPTVAATGGTVMVGKTIAWKGGATLKAYQFKGWNPTEEDADDGTATWVDSDAYPVPAAADSEITFYAVWDEEPVSLSAGSGHGALNHGPDKIINFVSPVGSGTDHTASDFTYTVEEATQPKDGLTVAAGTSGFTISGTPERVATTGSEITFNVKAVSKLNGEAATSTIKITVEPTFTVKYDWNTTATVSGTLPTDSKMYIASGNTAAFGLQNSVSISTTPPTRSGYTFGGWSFKDDNTGAFTGSNTGSIIYTIADGATAQEIAATGGEITVYAVWLGTKLQLQLNNLKAVYHMDGEADADTQDKWVEADHSWLQKGIDLTAATLNQTGAAALTFAETGLPGFLEIVKKDNGHYWLKLKDNTRVGDAKTYNISITVHDSGHGGGTEDPNEATANITLTVDKAMPVIQDPAIANVPHYAGDDPLEVFNYTMVHDPYMETDETGYQLTAGTNGKTETSGSWTANPNKLATASSKYTFTYTPVDTANYESPATEQTINVVERKISLEVMDNNKVSGTWEKDFVNSNTFTYTGEDNWVKVQVKIRIPKTNTSDIEKLIWDSTYDGAFKEVTVVQADGSTVRGEPSTLNRSDDDAGEWILTFKVNQGRDTASHQLKFTFTGEAGVIGDSLTSNTATPAGNDRKGSFKTTSATYTYSMGSQANKLAKPDPDLTRIEVDDGIVNPDGSNDDKSIDYTKEKFKDQAGKDVDETLGGLHLIFKPIRQDNHKNDATNPVKHYVVTLTGNKAGSATPNSITITPDKVDADGYFHYYWDADLTNGPVPNSDYTVEVQAISRDTDAYEDSDKGDDAAKAGYRKLTVANWGQLTDKVFNGKQQNGGSLTSPTGVGTITVRYYKDSTSPANTLPLATTGLDTTQLHVNIDPENSGHEYAVYVTVAQGTLYLPITEPTLYPYAGNAAGNDPYWKITQATAEMTLTKSGFTGQTMQTVDLRPGPKMKYKTGNPPDHYYGADGTTNANYGEFVYTITRVPPGSTRWTQDQTLTEAQLRTFIADVTDATGYRFKATAAYKTGDDADPQFEADVGLAEANFTFTTTARTVREIRLERYEAWNGAAGVTGVDTNEEGGNQNLSEVRPVTYGTPVGKTADRNGYYDAANNSAAKQMRLEGLRITVIWTAGENDVYVVGEDNLPDGMVWKSSNSNVIVPTALTDYDLDFKGAGISTNLSVSYGGKSSTDGGKNPVVYTMAKRPIDYTVVSDQERVWDNTSKVTGHIEFTLPSNLTGDDVKIAVSGDQFQTTNVKYDAWDGTPYAADTGYTVNSDVGKDKLVRAVNAGNSGSGNDVSGANRAFYRTGMETPGKASITPRLVTSITIQTKNVTAGAEISKASVSINTSDGLSGNHSKLTANTYPITWKVLKENGDPNVETDWEDPADATFLANRVYRPIITVQANTNHYLALSDDYKLNDRKNGQTWEENERTYTTEISVVDNDPYHPDWLPDRNVLYNNKGTFMGVIDLTVTPELRFDDVHTTNSSDSRGPLTNLVRIVQATTGQTGLGSYDINLGAYVRDVYDITVSSPTGELLTDAGAVITPSDKQGSGHMKTGATTEENGWLHWNLDLSGVDTSTKGIYTMTITAKGSAKPGTKANDINASYTFALVVDEPRVEPQPQPPSVEQSIIVLYWVSLKGKTNDLTGEKIPASGGRPTFVPKIIGLDGWVFKGWSETDPTKLKDGEKPELVDPLKIKLTTDKIYYAYYEKEEVDHVHFVRGYPDGTFRPDNYITRAEVATIIARSCLEGFEEGKDYGNPGGYSDIGTKRWYTSAISYCSMAGVFTGYPDGTFRPNDYITRQELALVVGRLAGLRVNMGLPFEDASSVNKWARDGVYTCYILGYVDGYKDGTFRPKNDITRAETVKIFNGYLNRGVDAKGLEGMTPFVLDASAGSYQINGTTEYLTWEDVPEKHWAYYEIIEASNDHDFHWPEDENDTSKKDAPPEDWDAVYIEAEWRYRATYAITWSVSEGTVAETTTKVALSKAPVAPEVTPDEGRVFLGWALTEGGEVVDLTTISITGAQTFYGIFADDGALIEPKTFTVSFETGEWADLDGESAIAVEENGVLTTVPAAIAHEGYLFHGWSLTIGGEVIDPTTVIVTEDVTFFAVCEEKPVEPKSLTVTFLSGEQGDLTGETALTVEEGTFLTELPVVTAREGYVFAGWALTEGGAAVDPTQFAILEDTVFYALYTEQAQPEPEPEIPGTLYTIKAYIDGYEDGTFRPKEHITRATVASMIARAYGSDFDETFDYDLSAVSDITPDHWAAKAIGYCLEKGYFSGYPDGTFAPDGTMTRQEFAVVIAKLAGVQENQGLPFTDADSINKWARNYVYTVYVNGWITGYNDGTFKPKNLITRAEAVKIFNAFLGRSTTKESFGQVTEFDHVWSDFSSRNWAYPDIMEATNDHTYYLNEEGVAIWVDPSVAEAMTPEETQNPEVIQNPEEVQNSEENQNPEEQTPEVG